MKRLLLAVFFLVLALPAGAAAGGAPAQPRVMAIHFTADVDPVTQDWLNHELGQAAAQGYSAAVIVLDTPGGLEESMRKIVARELSLKIPVIVYVAPAGARAASAGVWISQAADLLAMAPQTNIGSSTPINGNGSNIGSDLRRKVVNDAAASLRGLAKSHGRNAKWADAAVRKASNLTAEEALQMNVIDVISPSLPALLNTIDGRVTTPRHFTLHTANATIVDEHQGFLTSFLSTLIDPNIVSLLFLAGLAGLGFELFHPGAVIPGAFGAICMVTALFGFSVLPLSWAGLALVLLGVALLVIDLHVPTSRRADTLGARRDVDRDDHALPQPPGAVPHLRDTGDHDHRAARRPVGLRDLEGGRRQTASRRELAPQEIVGMEGVVRPGGLVFVRGELWRAESDRPLREGEEVQVEALDGLSLRVRHI